MNSHITRIKTWLISRGYFVDDALENISSLVVYNDTVVLQIWPINGRICWMEPAKAMIESAEMGDSETPNHLMKILGPPKPPAQKPRLKVLT